MICIFYCNQKQLYREQDKISCSCIYTPTAYYAFIICYTAEYTHKTLFCIFLNGKDIRLHLYFKMTHIMKFIICIHLNKKRLKKKSPLIFKDQKCLKQSFWESTKKFFNLKRKTGYVEDFLTVMGILSLLSYVILYSFP